MNHPKEDEEKVFSLSEAVLLPLQMYNVSISVSVSIYVSVSISM